MWNKTLLKNILHGLAKRGGGLTPLNDWIVWLFAASKTWSSARHGQQGRWSDPFTDWIVYFFQHAKSSRNMKQNIKPMNHAFFSWNCAWQGTWSDSSFFLWGGNSSLLDCLFQWLHCMGVSFLRSWSPLSSDCLRWFCHVVWCHYVPFLFGVLFVSNAFFWVPLSAYDFWALILSKACF